MMRKELGLSLLTITSAAAMLGCGFSNQPAESATAGATDGSTTDPATGTGTAGTNSDSGGNTSGTGGQEPETGDWVFDPQALRTYNLEIAPADLDTLNADPLLEQYVPATLHVDGREIGPIGVRYKGSFGSLDSCVQNGVVVCAKLSMKLRFDEYVPDQLFDGLKRLNFHSMESDPSKLHDRLAYGLFRDFGVPASRAVHAQLVINGELVGLFALIEQVDGRFARMNFEDGAGNLYKEIWPEHLTQQPYLDALKTNRDEMPDAGKMVAFATALQAAPVDGVGAVIDQWMDRDTLARLVAVDRVIENWDGIMGFWCVGGACGNHNYYWYEETGANRVWLVPWDLDHTFDSPNFFKESFGEAHWADLDADCTPIPVIDGFISRRAASCDHVIAGLRTSMWDDYAAASVELLDTLFTEQEINLRIDTYVQQIAPAVLADPDLAGGMGWDTQVEVLRAATVTLRAGIAAEVGG